MEAPVFNVIQKTWQQVNAFPVKFTKFESDQIFGVGFYAKIPKKALLRLENVFYFTSNALLLLDIFKV